MDRVQARDAGRRFTQAFLVFVVSVGLPFFSTAPASADTLSRIRDTGKLTLGYRSDARPFSFDDGSGRPVGYSVTLCEKVADEIKSKLDLPQLNVEWVPVASKDRFAAVEQGKVDVLCSADTVTLDRREKVAFSMPIYPGGISAMLRADSPAALQNILSGRPPTGPIWRASPAQLLQGKTFSVVSGTTGQAWLSARVDQFQLTAKIVPVDSYDAGVSRVLEGSTDVFFGDRPVLLEAAAKSGSPRDLIVLGRLFTFEPSALVVARNDDDFRLEVDRALSQYLRTDEFWNIYTKWFGPPDEGVFTFFFQSVASK